MLPKENRLPLRREFLRVKERGRLIPGKFFSLIVASRKDSHPSRFAFIISKKIHKKATRRNRIRRLLVESIRSLLPKIKSGQDCVFLVKKSILDKELSVLKKEVEKFFL